MLRFKLSLRQLKNHFVYDAWKYMTTLICVIVLAVLVFNVTGIGKTPRDKQLSVYFTGMGLRSDLLIQLEYQASLAMPQEDIEEVFFVYLPYDSTSVGSNQNISNAMAVARQGDVYILDEDFFRQTAYSGFLQPLDDYVDSEQLILPQDLEDRSQGYHKREGETVNRLYGIPLKDFEGLDGLQGNITEQTSLYRRNKYLVMVSYTPNPDKALQMMNWLMDTWWKA